MEKWKSQLYHVNLLFSEDDSVKEKHYKIFTKIINPLNFVCSNICFYSQHKKNLILSFQIYILKHSIGEHSDG